MLEIGKIKELNLNIQHESGLLFANGYDNMDIMVVESNPKIAKGEIVENNSKIRISAYKEGETNIILYLKNSRKILDVFKVSVDTTLELPTDINLLLGSKMTFFTNDSKKLNFINNLDAKFTSDNRIIEITKNSIRTIREGSTILRIETPDGRTIASSNLNIYSLNSISIELGNLPSYLTDKKDHRNYKPVYTFPFIYRLPNTKYLSDQFTDSHFKAHTIDFDVNTTCTLDTQTSLISVETSSNKKECIVKLKDQMKEFEKNIQLTLNSNIREEHSGYYSKESKIELKYHPGYITKTKQIQFSSLSDNKEFKVLIAKPHQENNIVVTSKTPHLLNISHRENSHFIVRVQNGIEDSFESEILISDESLHQDHKIKVIYDKESKSSVIYMLLILVLILLFIIIIILWLFGGEEKRNVEVKPQNSYTFTDYKKRTKVNDGKLFESNKNY